MDTSTRAILAAGIAAGYVVGRTKKGKLALSLVSLVAGRNLDPTALIGQGVSKLAENPQVAQLSEQLLGSGRSALSEVTNRGAASLASALQQRTHSLLDTEDGQGEDTYEDEEDVGEEDGPEDEEEQEVWDEDEEAEEPEEDEVEDEPEPPRSAQRRRAKKAAAKPTDRAPGPKNPPAKKAMVRKAADTKAAEMKDPPRRAGAKTARRRGRR